MCIRDRVPVEDIGLLILDAPTTTYTHSVLTEVLAAGAAVIPCGSNHHPAGMFLPQQNTLQVQRVADQAAASLPLKKRLWKQIVRRKIRNQAFVLPKDSPARKALVELASHVRSGDPANVEAQAARRYWRAMFGDGFRREREGASPNNFLNYGYMAMRAAVARALCGAGLHPSLGLHHHNRSNTFCLADDLLEPLRPVVDRKVLNLHRAGAEELDRQVKYDLLSVLTEEVALAGATGPVMVALERVVASLVRCYEGTDKELLLPDLCN